MSRDYEKHDPHLRQKIELLEQTNLDADQKWNALDCSLEEVKVIVFSETGKLPENYQVDKLC